MATLLAIVDPGFDDLSALKRAEQLAIDTGARLHLFCCDYLHDISAFSSRKEAKASTLAQNKAQLEALAEPLRQEGIAVSTEAYWNSEWQESAVHASSRVGAYLILKSSPLKTPGSDSEAEVALLRKANSAVLLVRDSAPWTHQRILAAITPDGDDSGHDLLNNQIITQAHRLGQATQSTVHCVTALEQKLQIVDVFILLADNHLPDEAEVHSNEEHISQRFGVPPERIHIHLGPPREVILQTVEELRVDVLIIGTVARHGVKAALMGNTAEKLLSVIDTDILVVN
ncbi:universal stress protein [Pseudomaricurvus sp.]|uniref:universal stress protein n=1 Tax=Pseudomaricurvus sp. TaxID=2004510 RepID=UPI003F6AE941